MDAGHLGLMIPIIGVMIPIVAIVSGVGSGIFKMWINHQQEIERIRASRVGQAGQATSESIEGLREELAKLRDTTTQYDMSVERSLVEIRHRLDFLERRSTTEYTPAAESRADPPPTLTTNSNQAHPQSTAAARAEQPEEAVLRQSA